MDILKSKGLLQYRGPAKNAATQAAPLTTRERIIDEVVKTERDYVQHLEMLQSFQNAIHGAVPGDAMHDIFLNLNQLLDFQRRFLIRIEQQNSLSEPDQNWGKLFSHYRDGFKVYEPFLANQTRCNNAVMKEWKKLQGAILPSSELGGMVESPTILLGFLIKPFQRLSKYPLLLRVFPSLSLTPVYRTNICIGARDKGHLRSRAKGRPSGRVCSSPIDHGPSRRSHWEGKSA